ncbi:MAG: TIGR02569 family protein [Mycobacteriaceae bacterium]
MSATDRSTPPADLPPVHVLATFGLRAVEPEPLGSAWSRGWRCGDVVLTPVTDHARATWSAGVRETLKVEGVRLARPVRSTDGRWVASGWTANTFLAGEPEPRHDEVVSVSTRLHHAMADLSRPRFLRAGPRTPDTAGADVFADAVAWGEEPESFISGGREFTPLDAPSSASVFSELAGARMPVQSPSQLVHGDLFGTVLFAGAAAPGVTELTPYWRPAAWASAVAVVDAVAWGGADDGLLTRWAYLPEWPQMLLRALLFRLAVHTLHPRSTPEAFGGLARAADLVRERL